MGHDGFPGSCDMRPVFFQLETSSKVTITKVNPMSPPILLVYN